MDDRGLYGFLELRSRGEGEIVDVSIARLLMKELGDMEPCVVGRAI